MNDACTQLWGEGEANVDTDFIQQTLSSSVSLKKAWIILQSGEVWKGAFPIKNRQQQYWLSATITPLLTESGEVYQYLAIGYDISDQKRLEDQKHHSLKRQSELSLKYQELNEQLFWKQERLAAQLKEIQSLNDALVKREQLLHHMGRIAQVTGWEMDLETRHITWTPEVYVLFGLEADAKQPTFNELCHCISPEDSNILKQNIKNHTASVVSPNFDFECSFNSLNNEVRWVRFSCQKSLDSNTKIHGIIKDITARKEAAIQLVTVNNQLQNKFEEERITKESLANALEQLKATQAQLVHAEKMSSLGQIAAGIAHEINNPINFVSVGISVVKELVTDIEEFLGMYPNPEEIKSLSTERLRNLSKGVADLRREIEIDSAIESAKEVIETIEEGAIRTKKIVQGLKNFSRIDEATIKKVDLHEGLDSTLLLLGHKLRNKVKVVKKYDTNLPKAECYPGAINQVFMNIITNAIQAIKKQGVITISTKYDEDCVYIHIEDNGPGIPNKIRNHIFNPFFTTKPIGEGTGLGLSISHSIIEKHQGKISVTSDEGKGTAFELVLPISLNL